jgi:hypothetical protein
MPFNDLDVFFYPGSTTANSFHVLPDLTAGSVVSGSGTISYNATGAITGASLQVSAPAGLGFTYSLTPVDLSMGWDSLNNPNDPRAGFTLVTGSFESDHPAVLPATAPYDIIGSVYFQAFVGDASMTIKVIHPSIVAFATVDVPVDITQFRIVPEPASLALLAIGAAALAGGGRMGRRRSDGSPPFAERQCGPDEGVV